MLLLLMPFGSREEFQEFVDDLELEPEEYEVIEFQGETVTVQ